MMANRGQDNDSVWLPGSRHRVEGGPMPEMLARWWFTPLCLYVSQDAADPALADDAAMATTSSSFKSLDPALLEPATSGGDFEAEAPESAKRLVVCKETGETLLHKAARQGHLVNYWCGTKVKVVTSRSWCQFKAVASPGAGLTWHIEQLCSYYYYAESTSVINRFIQTQICLGNKFILTFSNTQLLANAVLMLAHRLRCWPNIKPILSRVCWVEPNMFYLS